MTEHSTGEHSAGSSSTAQKSPGKEKNTQATWRESAYRRVKRVCRCERAVLFSSAELVEGLRRV